MDTTPPGEAISLPRPLLHGKVGLDDALATRRSVRRFTDTPLTETEISQLLWAAQGLTPTGNRTAPSAGATFPIEVYLASSRGIFHYRPQNHDLVAISASDVRSLLTKASLGQEAVRDAPAVFAVTAVIERTAAKYGDRALRYVNIEVGHVGQNLLLEATALGLGGVPVGAFDDDAVSEILGLSRDRAPLYLLPIGHASD